jgi:hypothetical protein
MTLHGSLSRIAAVILASVGLLSASCAHAADRPDSIDQETKESQTIFLEPDPSLGKEEGTVWLGYLMALAANADKRANTLKPGPLVPTFDEEVAARKAVAQIYRESRQSDDRIDLPYFSTLVMVDDAGFIPEYIWVYLRNKAWAEPSRLRLSEFEKWRERHLQGHTGQTHGSIKVAEPGQ